MTSKIKMSNISVKLSQIVNKAPSNLKDIEVSDYMKDVLSEISAEVSTLNVKYFLNRFKNLDFEHVDELHQTFYPVRSKSCEMTLLGV